MLSNDTTQYEPRLVLVGRVGELKIINASAFERRMILNVIQCLARHGINRRLLDVSEQPDDAVAFIRVIRANEATESCFAKQIIGDVNDFPNDFRGGLTRSDSFLRFLSGTSEAIMLPI
ncbi:hypothetical protein [Burkholderia pseudomallei]|uniref:hypothetical protein n=1 Tax=Burkholderia pseudomallei TaxID=28450 RepID=UPI0015E33AE6|nr:hypothetical protein [Burkholderia pseudomallei]